MYHDSTILKDVYWLKIQHECSGPAKGPNRQGPVTSNPFCSAQGIKSVFKINKMYFYDLHFSHTHLEPWTDLGVRVLTMQVHPFSYHEDQRHWFKTSNSSIATIFSSWTEEWRRPWESILLFTCSYSHISELRAFITEHGDSSHSIQEVIISTTIHQIFRSLISLENSVKNKNKGS